jgi:hypothetical protein
MNYQRPKINGSKGTKQRYLLASHEKEKKKQKYRKIGGKSC